MSSGIREVSMKTYSGILSAALATLISLSYAIEIAGVHSDPPQYPALWAFLRGECESPSDAAIRESMAVVRSAAATFAGSVRPTLAERESLLLLAHVLRARKTKETASEWVESVEGVCRLLDQFVHKDPQRLI